jgi:L-2-hydroxyglutarate oxidase
MPSSRIYDVAVIGGGVVGCSLARELTGRFKHVLLLEKERAVACHTSGRNSGVVHSGFNPKAGTLKAKLCVEGNHAIRRYAQERGVPFQQVGTYVVARTEAELERLKSLKANADRNGVPAVEIQGIEAVREREPRARGVAALFSPSGGIVDSRSLTHALAADAQHEGAEIRCGQKVEEIRETRDEVRVQTGSDAFRTRLLVNCAGLHADRLAHRMGVGSTYTILPFRGEYCEITGTSEPIISSMIYPVPHPSLPFLGIHLTKTINRTVLIGPNAVPAFGREAYSRWGVEPRYVAGTLLRTATWKALIHNRELLHIAWQELTRSFSRRQFFLEASRLVEGLRPEELRVSKRVGIRPQLLKDDGQLVEDLVIETTPRSIHVLNVVSPGMTCAIPFARWLTSHIGDDLKWKGSETTVAG